MKGSINKGIKDMVTTTYGQAAWEAVRERAGCEEAMFLPAHSYPDQLTYDLVGAAAEVLGLDPETVMVEFGKWWVKETDREVYPAIFRLAGGTLETFLRNIDRVHQQVTRTIPGAMPPRFEYEDLPDGRLALHYFSDRGLPAVVRGAILGAAEYFGSKIEVETAETSRPGACSTFLLRLGTTVDAVT